MVRNRAARRLTVALAANFLLAVLVVAPRPQLAAANTYPGYVHSHYITSTSTTAVHTAGCSLGSAVAGGHAPDDVVVVLDFGYPDLEGSTWGVLLITSSYPFVSLSSVATIAENFAGGYWACSPVGTTLELAIGENTSRVVDDAGHTHYYFNSSNGTAFANMVDTVNAWLVSNGYSSQVTASGAADMESGSGWQTPTGDRAWAAAYAAASSSKYFDFGDAAGCSRTSYNNSQTCNGGFTQNDYWYLAWGASPAFPLPEIYNDTNITVGGSYSSDANAIQWEMIKRYGVNYQSSYMTIQGDMTQRTACNEVGGCSGVDNTPSEGWGDLYNALNHHTSPSQTSQSLRWATDIEWGYTPCSTDPNNPGTYPC
jgi:hypothetical protein